MSPARLREFARHQQNGTYYVRIIPGGYVTKQIHPDGLVFLKRNGYVLGSIISTDDMATLKSNDWLHTWDEIPHWGELNWAPEWYQIGLPRTKGKLYPRPISNSHAEVDELKKAQRLVRESEREVRETSKAVASAEKKLDKSSQRVGSLAEEMNRRAEALRSGAAELTITRPAASRKPATPKRASPPQKPPSSPKNPLPLVPTTESSVLPPVPKATAPANRGQSSVHERQASTDQLTVSVETSQSRQRTSTGTHSTSTSVRQSRRDQSHQRRAQIRPELGSLRSNQVEQSVPASSFTQEPHRESPDPPHFRPFPSIEHDAIPFSPPANLLSMQSEQDQVLSSTPAISSLAFSSQLESNQQPPRLTPVSKEELWKWSAPLDEKPPERERPNHISWIVLFAVIAVIAVLILIASWD